MNLGPETKVREIATAIPASLRYFERWGIDYCCGGGRPLAEACTRAGVSTDEVVATIRELADAPESAHAIDWRERPLEALLDHLVEKHHAFTRSELERATALATKVARVHGERHPELREVLTLVLELRDDLLLHLRKEEQVLFPYVRERLAGVPGVPASLARPIQCMETEHEEAGSILHRLREVTKGYAPPDDACGSYRALYQSLTDLEADLHVHIHLENDVLFPRALAITTKAAS